MRKHSFYIKCNLSDGLHIFCKANRVFRQAGRYGSRRKTRTYHNNISRFYRISSGAHALFPSFFFLFSRKNASGFPFRDSGTRYASFLLSDVRITVRCPLPHPAWKRMDQVSSFHAPFHAARIPADRTGGPALFRVFGRGRLFNVPLTSRNADYFIF